MEILIGEALVALDNINLTARFYVQPDTDEAAPPTTLNIQGNRFSPVSSPDVASLAHQLKLYGMLFNDIDGLFRKSAWNQPQRLQAWMSPRVGAAVSDYVTANPTPAPGSVVSNAILFGQWLQFWIDWALNNAEIPAAVWTA